MPAPVASVQTGAFPYSVDLLAAAQAEPELFPFLLESAARGGAQGRRDILFARPDPEMLVLHADGRLTGCSSVSARAPSSAGSALCKVRSLTGFNFEVPVMQAPGNFAVKRKG